MTVNKFPAAKINAEIERWQKKLSLGDWEIDWSVGGRQSHSVTQECNGAVFYLCGGRCANIELSPFCNSWKQTIKHEMLEILLADMGKMIDKEKHPEWQIEATKHSVIRRLEKVIK